MSATAKIDLSRTQFELLCKSLFAKFLSLLDEEDFELIPTYSRIKNDGNNQDFINKNWESFISQLPSTAKSELSNVGAVFVDQIFDDRIEAKIGENLDYILSESLTNKHEYSKIFTSFLKRKYDREYKPNKSKKIKLGGTKRAIDKFKSSLLFWYLGYTTADDFITQCPDENKADNDLIIQYLSRNFSRKDEWDKIPKEFEEGIWRMEATESEMREDPFAKNTLMDKGEDFRYVHKRNIEYDVRFSYWCDLDIKHSDQRGFFLAEGKIFTNTMIPELNEWLLKAVGSFRSSRGTQYINIEFEMFPKENIDSPRTFGYCLTRPFFNEKVPILEGFYTSNRMRDPFDYADKDNGFMNGLRISMGRMVMYKK